MDKQHIINEIKRTAKENGGRPLGRGRLFNETGISRTDWEKYWPRLGDAHIDAGYEPNTLQGKYNEEFIIEKMISFIRDLDKYPVVSELRLKASQDENFPNVSTFRRVGNKANLTKKIIEYCEARDGYDDIVEICKPIAEDSQQESPAPGKEPTIGYVYLTKSGRYYKIGKTNSPGRRGYELDLILPEKPEEIHTIATDDPTGIEKYWQERFKDKITRKDKKPEWFDLSSEDIKAFKRWRKIT